MNDTFSTYGIGLEAEGFIMDTQGRPLSRIDGQPASAWVLQRLQRDCTALLANVGLELASVFLEVKTGVHSNKESAVAEVVALRQQLNEILRGRGARLIFTPVSEYPFEFVPSSELPGSRAAELVQRWGQTVVGRENLIASSVASLQINDSRPFASCHTLDQKLEKSRIVHNLCRQSLPKHHHLLVSSKTDFRGRSRVRNYSDLVKRVEREKFIKHGFVPEDAILPPHFARVSEMQKWICAYADNSDFAQTNPKDEHAITCKIKRYPWMVEVRYPDAVDTPEEMLATVSLVEEILRPTYV